MNRDQLDNVDYFFKFVGYGDPKSPLWFVGIEEGEHRSSESLREPVYASHRPVDGIDAKYDPDHPDPKEGEKSNQVWGTCRDIAIACGLDKQYFMSNMAPLPRRNQNYPLPGIKEPTYTQRVRVERIPLLKQLVDKFRPKAIVFHGKGAWRRYHVACKFGEVLAIPDTHVLKSKNVEEHVLLANSFSWGRRHFSKCDRIAVETMVKAWLRR